MMYNNSLLISSRLRTLRVEWTGWDFTNSGFLIILGLLLFLQSVLHATVSASSELPKTSSNRLLFLAGSPMPLEGVCRRRRRGRPTLMVCKKTNMLPH